MDDLIDDIREEMDTATHISDAISTPLDSSMQSDVRAVPCRAVPCRASRPFCLCLRLPSVVPS